MTLLRRLSRKTVLAALLGISVVLAALPARCSRRICHVVRPLLAPLGKGGMYLTTHVRERVSELAGQADKQEDAETVALLAAIHEQLQSQRERIAQLTRWREVLGEEFPCRLIEASVVGAEGLALRDRRQLDVGRSQGISPGDLATTRRLLHRVGVALPEYLTVLGRNYVVGRIIDSGAHTATLQLVTDPQFRMPACVRRMLYPGARRVIYVERPGGGRVQEEYKHDGRPGAYPIPKPIPVLAQGDGRRIVLRHVPAQHGIQPGDLLTTAASTELLLPFGLTIGRVVGAEPDKQDAHAVTVLVEPLADLATLREVYVVMPLARGEGSG